jgi:hypothetical protein
VEIPETMTTVSPWDIILLRAFLPVRVRQCINALTPDNQFWASPLRKDCQRYRAAAAIRWRPAYL